MKNKTIQNFTISYLHLRHYTTLYNCLFSYRFRGSNCRPTTRNICRNVWYFEGCMLVHVMHIFVRQKYDGPKTIFWSLKVWDETGQPPLHFHPPAPLGFRHLREEPSGRTLCKPSLQLSTRSPPADVNSKACWFSLGSWLGLPRGKRTHTAQRNGRYNRLHFYNGSFFRLHIYSM